MAEPDRHAQVTALFHRALGHPTAERERWLETACPDTDLRREVRAMLAHTGGTGLLDTPALHRPPEAQPIGASGDGASGTDPMVDQTVGPWRVDALLGRGGMGAVYRATRDDDTFRQQAALKVVRPGLGADFHARFLRERALLASLDHPGIARLLDGGVGAGGTPYLAMELVRGEPITAYADARGLDVEARLRLFLDACDAVAYAHRNLVVHRDLKPDHIVVASGEARNGGAHSTPPLGEVPAPAGGGGFSQDGSEPPEARRFASSGAASRSTGTPPPTGSAGAPRGGRLSALVPRGPGSATSGDRANPGDGVGRVKLLDFGVARLLDDEDAGLTRTGLGPLTPAYASPEQVLGRPVTTATDVYTLGVILYELLAGRRPYDLSGMTAAQAERAVTETEPPPPSASPEARRFASSGGARALRGDLDAVVLKALAKEPERRYASADALADDLRRHLAGEPVLARPATARYRAGRFVRRHRIGVAVAVAMLAVLVGMSALYGVRVRAERDIARASAAEAEAQAERAEAVAGFLEQILRAPNSRWYVDAEAKGPDTPIRAVLAEAAARIDRDFATEPDLRADLHHVLGDTYLGIGLQEEAAAHHLETLALRESLYTAPHPALAEALYYAAAYLDPRDVLTELDALERAATMLRQRPEGNNLPFILQEIADFHLALGEPDRALAAAREGLAFARETFVPGHPGHRYRDVSIRALSREAALASLDLGASGDAERWLTQGNTSASDSPLAWGQLRAAQARYAEAEPLLLAERSAVAPFRSGSRAMLEEHRQGRAAITLATLYEATGRADLARAERQRLAPHLASRDSLRHAWRQRLAR